MFSGDKTDNSLGKVTVVDKIGFSTDIGSTRFGQAAGYYRPFLR